MATSSTRIRLPDPGALVAAVPYLLGFVPADSVVGVGVRGRRGGVCLTLRVDLPAVVEGVAGALVGQLRRAGADAAVFLLIGTSCAGPPSGKPRALPHRDVADALRTAGSAGGVPVLDVLWVDGGRWRSYFCADPACCPPEGTAVDPSAAHALAAELALSGRGVLPDRGALERSVAPRLPLGRYAAAASFESTLADVVAEVSAGLHSGGQLPWEPADAALSEALDRCEPGCAGLTDQQSARLVAYVALQCITSEGLGWLDGPRHDAAEAVWLRLTQAAPPPWGVAPATLLALYAYARGDGPLARVAVERALADDPGNPRACLVGELLDGGVPPGQVVESIRRAVGRLDRRARHGRGG